MDKFRSQSTARRMRTRPISYHTLLLVYLKQPFIPLCLWLPDFASPLWNFSPSKTGCCALTSKCCGTLLKGFQLAVSGTARGVVANYCSTAWWLEAGSNHSWGCLGTVLSSPQKGTLTLVWGFVATKKELQNIACCNSNWAVKGKYHQA